MEKNIKLSECIRPGHIFLYDGETVGLQYILRQIFNDKKLPEIQLCSNQEQLNKAIETSLSLMMRDVQNGTEKESYSLGILDTILVEIDIEKQDIKKLDDEGYHYKITK